MRLHDAAKDRRGVWAAMSCLNHKGRVSMPPRQHALMLWRPMSPLLLILCCALLAGGCATRAVATSMPTTTSCSEPSLTPVQMPARQQDGDITITVAPELPICESLVRISYTPTEPPSLDRLFGIVGVNDDVPWYQRLEQRRLAVRDLYGFNVTIVNQSPRVFRGAGMVVQYQVDGQETPMDDRSYTSVVNTQILPGQQRQVRISDLDHKRIGDGATIGLYLYDVVVERDDAGVPTRRSNFEWFFTMQREVLTEPGSDTTCTVPLTEIPGGISTVEADYLLAEEEFDFDDDGLNCPRE